MTIEIRLRDEAEKDLTEAAAWYEQQLSGLGHEFLDTALSFLNAIIHKDVRRALLPRFPFGVYYRIEANCILVHCVLHASRDPGRWQDRT